MRDVASIVGLKVISSSEGREVGTVSQVVVDLASGEIVGLIVGKGAAEKGIDAADVDVIGTDAVMVRTYKVARHLSELPRLMEKRLDPAAPPREVVSDTGKRLGILGTVYIDPATRRVTRYEVSGGTWRDITEGVLSLAPMEGTVDGRDTIVVPTKAFRDLPTAGGLRAQLAKLAEIAKAQAKQAAESLEEGAESARRSVATVSERVSASAKPRSKKTAGTTEKAAATAAGESAPEPAAADQSPPAQPADESSAPPPEADSGG